MKEVICGIYCIENVHDGKKYIGQSKDIYYRWRKHVNELNSNSHKNNHLQNSWNLYGSDAFKFYIVEECEQCNLDEREKYYINFYNTLDDSKGYNLKAGGQNCKADYTEEILKKISDGVRRSYEKGDLRKRRSDCTKRYWENPENKARILKENNVMYGKHHTEESKRKMSEVKRSKHRESWRRNKTKVFCEELNTEYLDATTAGKELGLDSCGILKTCRGEHHTCGGYHWHFVANNDDGK